ncbi:hypothetical protein CTAYLR_002145 [Chrysophaeum taylorii]|uniref:Methyltransferase type 11 domain-containing protein n=1 Tax=Chrysophaeum taylorii TaxID=2483200 RepID=A0AAD7UNV9_9STRA|nr:hypothetical protein CTAYLR_002145 [Chrysophaeum taylorii]
MATRRFVRAWMVGSSLAMAVRVQETSGIAGRGASPQVTPVRQGNGVVPLQPSHKSGMEDLMESESAAAAPTTSPDRYEAEFRNPEWREKYWADPRMHGFGNQGSPGAVLHALVAPLFTFMLDQFAYHGKDVRAEAWKFIKWARNRNVGAPHVTKAVDLGCGTGFTARSLARAFFSRLGGRKNEVDVVALDLSPEMLRVARDINFLTDDGTVDGIEYILANAEETGLPSSRFDVVTAAFVFHECPREARARIMEEGLRLLAPGGTLAILDIHTDYEPSKFMLPGEPYIRGYLDHFEDDVSDFARHHANRFAFAHRDVVIPGRLILWHFHAKPENEPVYFDIAT